MRHHFSAFVFGCLCAALVSGCSSPSGSDSAPTSPAKTVAADEASGDRTITLAPPLSAGDAQRLIGEAVRPYRSFPSGSRIAVQVPSVRGLIERLLTVELVQSDASLDNAGWRPRNAYFHRIVACLPDWLPAWHRHDGYYNGHYAEQCNKDDARAFAVLIHEADRDPEVLRSLWKTYSADIFTFIDTERYVNWEFAPMVDVLRTTYSRLRKLPNWQEKLLSVHRAVLALHANNANRHGNGWIIGATYAPLLGPNDPGNYTPWAESFWVRRAAEGNIEVVREILDQIAAHYDADPRFAGLAKAKKQTDSNGALREAAECRNYMYKLAAGCVEDMIRAVDAGADAGAAVGIGDFPPFLAAVLNDSIGEVAERLKTQGPEWARKKTWMACTAVHFARSADMIRLLAAHGMDINAGCSERSRLYTALHQGNGEAVRALLDVGADVLPGDAAYACYMPEIVPILIKKGVNMSNAWDAHGMTALARCIERGQVDAVRALLQAGVTVDEKSLRAAQRHSVISALLLEEGVLGKGNTSRQAGERPPPTVPDRRETTTR